MTTAHEAALLVEREIAAVTDAMRAQGYPQAFAHFQGTGAGYSIIPHMMDPLSVVFDGKPYRWVSAPLDDSDTAFAIAWREINCLPQIVKTTHELLAATLGIES